MQKLYPFFEAWLSHWWNQNSDLPLFFTTQSIESDLPNFVVASLLLQSSSAKSIQKPILFQSKGQIQFQIFLSQNTQKIFSLIDLLNQKISYQEIQVSQTIHTLQFGPGSFRYVGEHEGIVQHHLAYPWTLYHQNNEISSE